ncbi:MAG TPA: hypothetical protein VMF64_07605 [Steroidobacteraceae bacterium]|nr:hypothetical protein [Steroidobacteraceae bacterium]
MSQVQPDSRDGLLAATVHLYRISFRRCFPVALIGALASALVGAYAALRLHALIVNGRALLSSALTGLGDLSGADSGASSLVALASQLQSMVQGLLSSPPIWASYLGASLITLACHGVLIAQQSAMASGEPADGQIGRALRRMPSLLLVAVLILIANGVAALIANWLQARSHYAALLLLMLVAAWLWGRLQLWLAAMFSDDLDAPGALQSSWERVRGHWWFASAATTVPYLVVFGLSALAALVASAFGAPDSAAQVWIGQICLVCASIIALPILPALWVRLYGALRQHSAPLRA